MKRMILLAGLVIAVLAVAIAQTTGVVTISVTIKQSIYNDADAVLRLNRAPTEPQRDTVESRVQACVLQVVQDARARNKSEAAKALETEIRERAEKLQELEKADVTVTKQ